MVKFLIVMESIIVIKEEQRDKEIFLICIILIANVKFVTIQIWRLQLGLFYLNDGIKMKLFYFRVY